MALPRFPRWLLIVFFIALSVRVAFVILQLNLGIFDIFFEAADSKLYRAIADNLLSEGSYAGMAGTPTAYVTPGYPLFLAAIMWISRSTMFIAIVQSFIGAATVVLLAAASARVAGPAAGLATGLIGAFYPHLVFWTGYVTTETLYVFFVAASVFLLVDGIVAEQRQSWRTFSAGIALGAGAITRPILLGFGLLIVVMAAATARWRHVAILVFAGIALVLAPWVVRNAVTMDAPIVTSTESGYVLYQGNSPGATGGSRGYVDLLDFTPLDLPDGLSETEIDTRYGRAAFSWMADHPAQVAALVPKKLWNMWRPTYEGASPTNTLITYATYLPLLILAAIGILPLYRIRRSAAWLVIIFLGYHLVVHGLITGMIRFRLPIEAVLTLPAGVALASIPIVKAATSRLR